MADSAAGSFTARYDADGRLTTQGYPNGLEVHTAYDETGSTVELAYIKTTNCASACTWLNFQAGDSIHGQRLGQLSALSSQAYSYDAAGRLTKVEDTPVGGGCTIRSYGYDADSNRTALTTKAPAADQSCNPAASGSIVTHSYDAADRITDAGYSYDSLGRITTVPAADAGDTTLTASYYTSDMVRSLTQGATTRTWTLDPNRRLRTRTDTGGATGSRTNHYQGDNDAPGWVAENADGSNWTRNIAGVDGDLAAIQDSAAGTTLQLANLHGDVVATASLDPAATGPLMTFEASEFGIPRSTPSPRYGWLGQKQRETDSLTSVMLMGVRLYMPAIGRFLQTDPVRSCSTNPYGYANQDPLNTVDLDGRWPWSRTTRWTRVVNCTVRCIAGHCGARALAMCPWFLPFWIRMACFARFCGRWVYGCYSYCQRVTR